VVLGKIYHHRTIKDYMIRVVVINVRDSSARVPMPTEKVQIVGHAPRDFYHLAN